ncbi:MAG: threonylcarbamoyl-AMP synthase, partial [Bacteroidales bacterium]|nr:threonylcarbamoyl-AMP synthase [Bacteroidales bacterium]
MKEDITKAIEVLQQGGIILYPTDTVWGIGCDATNEAAVKKIFDVKQRADSKAMLVLLDNENRLPSYIDEVPEVAWELLDVADKPLTLIYPGAKNVSKLLVADDGSLGIRIAKDEFCQRLIQGFKKPLVSTSANISGEPTPQFYHEISDDIVKQMDYVVG